MLKKLGPTLWRWSSMPDAEHRLPNIKVAMFDLDDTLVVANRRPKSPSDYTFVSGAIEHLTELATHAVPIVIVTNQSGIAHGNAKVLPRIEAIMKAIAESLPADAILQCYVAGAHDIYRKPMTGIFEQYIWPTFPNATQWLYVGDAAGRDNDFSSTDRKYAYNIDLIFQYLKTQRPGTDDRLVKLVETIYLDGQPIGKERPRLAFQVPEEAFTGNADTRPREWWGFYPGGYLKQETGAAKRVHVGRLAKIQSEMAQGQSAVIMIGAPGSGKSRLARIIAEKTSAIVISRDSYGSLAKFLDQVQKQVRAGRSVVLDATHPSHVSRGTVVVTVANATKACKIIYVHVDTPRNIAFHLNQVRMWTGNVYIPEHAYHKYYNELQEPDNCYKLPFYSEFASLDERFRFLQFTEEGAQHRLSTHED